MFTMTNIADTMFDMLRIGIWFVGLWTFSWFLLHFKPAKWLGRKIKDLIINVSSYFIESVDKR